jgi:Tol biopolymer transport system component
VAFLGGNDSIFAYSADHGEPELLGVQVVDPWYPHSFAWSPDGRLIAYVNGNPQWRTSANVSSASIWILDANGGEPVRVTDQEHMNLSPQWLPDSRHLLFVSDQDGPRGIYVVEVGPQGPRGPPRSVLSSSDPHSISISADGSRLAYAKFTVVQNIWSIPIPRSGTVSISDAVPVTEGNQVIETHSLSPDGEWIVFDSDIRGEFDIYKMPLAGGRPQLVADITGDAFAPDWSPDGAEIAFYGPGSEGTGGKGEVLVVSADGGTPEQLTNFPGFDNAPDWSPDGLAIAYDSQGPDGVGLENNWIVSRDSVGLPWSDPVQLTDFGCWWPDWAPDGASLVCREGGGKWARVSRDGEVLSRYDPSTAGLQVFASLKFSPDGSRIYGFGTHEDGSLGVWWIPANGGDATKVVAFDDPSLNILPAFLTVGVEHLYLTLAEYESDIWVMDLEW